jgi:hypothetical protein
VVVGGESRSNTATSGGISAVVHVTDRINSPALCTTGAPLREFTFWHVLQFQRCPPTLQCHRRSTLAPCQTSTSSLHLFTSIGYSVDALSFSWLPTSSSFEPSPCRARPVARVHMHDHIYGNNRPYRKIYRSEHSGTVLRPRQGSNFLLTVSPLAKHAQWSAQQSPQLCMSIRPRTATSHLCISPRVPVRLSPHWLRTSSTHACLAEVYHRDPSMAN